MYRGGRGRESRAGTRRKEMRGGGGGLEERSLPNGIRALVATVKDFPTWTRSNLRGPHFGD